MLNLKSFLSPFAFARTFARASPATATIEEVETTASMGGAGRRQRGVDAAKWQSSSGSGKIFAYAPWYDVNGNFPIDSALFLLPGKTLFSFCFHVFYYFKF